MCSKVESVTTLDCESILPCCPESTCEEELDSFECSEKSFKVSEDLEVVILRHNSEQLMRQVTTFIFNLESLSACGLLDSLKLVVCLMMTIYLTLTW